MLILLLTGAFISRYDLSGIVDRGIGPQEHAEQLNSAWLQENVISDQYNERGDGKGYNLNPNVVVNVRHRHHVEPSAVGPPPITHPGKYPIRPPNPPLDDVTYQRREKVKEVS